MLAKEIVEDNILPFMSQEPPNVVAAGESISQMVIFILFFSLLKRLLFALILLSSICVAEFPKDKDRTIFISIACKGRSDW